MCEHRALPLHPYTSLFRSPRSVGSQATISFEPIVGNTASGSIPVTPCRRDNASSAAVRSSTVPCVAGYPGTSETAARSEEHTSELQSRFDIVCRLLLEKKI